MVESLKDLGNYPWSGHAVVMEKMKREWQDTDTLLAYFGRRRRKAIKRYEEFVKEGIAQGRRDDLIGGGLVRSSGGWSQVLSLKGKEDKVASDERILGSGEFVQSIISEAGEKEKESLRLSLKKHDLTSIAKRISTGEGIEEAALRSGNRSMEVVRSRKIFCQIAVKKLGYSGAEVARYLGVTTSAVNRIANAEVLPKVRRYTKLF